MIAKTDMSLFPESARHLIALLHSAGYEAYFVGGCVRDLFLGHSANDIDLTTNADSESIIRVMTDGGYHACLIGGSCGTVGVKTDSGTVEITPYRAERGYTDHRHPSEVIFVKDLREDLARRDFTVNSLALTEHDGKTDLVDMFGGIDDMKNKLIRCVGDPRERFEEDALRILRAMRFSVSLGFCVHPETAAALREKRGLLAFISGERKSEELKKLLEKGNPKGVLNDFPEVFSEIVGNFVGNGVDFVPPRFCDRLFYIKRFSSSAELKKLVAELKLSCAEQSRILDLKRIFDESGQKSPIPREDMIRLTARYGLFFGEYLAVFGRYGDFSDVLDNPAFPKTVGELCVNGRDIASLGFSGKDIGNTLSELLVAVLCGKIKNDRNELEKYAIELKEDKK